MVPSAEGQVIAGKYRLERPLSKGGMGSVWVARHLDLGMPVAVKLMDPLTAARPAWRQRFAREAKAAGAIRSPHVVKVHDYGVDGETPYLVMELLHGEDLGVRLRREGRLSLEATARLVLAIAKGLKRAHEAGVVHRDLKPANVFLARVDDDEIVQILDFGIAKLTRADGETDRTETGVVMGSIHYMSPEQARGFRDADHRADIWSLGVLAYRALTGVLPFPGEESGDVLVKVCTDPAPAPSPHLRSLDPPLARQLDRFFARALAKNPAERFQTARELSDTLCSIAGLEIDTTAPGSRAEPLAPDGGEEAPTRTEAIAGLALPLPAEAAEQAVERDGESVETGTADLATTTGPAPTSSASPGRRRAAWAVVAVLGVGALAVLLATLTPRSAPDSLSPIPAASPPAASAAEPVSVLPADTAPTGSTTTSLNTTSAPRPPEPAGTTASATAPNRPSPPAPPRPAPKQEDRVKAKFGF